MRPCETPCCLAALLAAVGGRISHASRPMQFAKPYGSKELPRPWSKYSEGSSKHDKKEAKPVKVSDNRAQNCTVVSTSLSSALFEPRLRGVQCPAQRAQRVDRQLIVACPPARGRRRLCPSRRERPRNSLAPRSSPRSGAALFLLPFLPPPHTLHSHLARHCRSRCPLSRDSLSRVITTSFPYPTSHSLQAAQKEPEEMDPELAEFMALMQPRSKQKLWVCFILCFGPA